MAKSTDVYANDMEISGKATKNKSIAAMPDVCLSPPAPPAGPIPIPYPNTSLASDTTAGTRRVRIGKKEVGMKNKSKYKKSTGDEPATRNFGAGVITHQIKGAMKFAAWSMNVKVESANVTRFMDLTTHNHANPSNAAFQSSIAGRFPANDDTKCEELADSNDKARKDLKSGRHGRTKPGVKSLKEAASDNTTITHARYSPPGGGAPGMMRGCSKAPVHQYDNSFSEGLTADDLKKMTNADGTVESRVCGGGKHKYEKGFRPLTSHTESRILEDIFRKNPAGGGNLLLSINWPSAPRTATPESPCPNCLKLICAATECMEIFICDEENEPKNAKDTCDEQIKPANKKRKRS